MGEMTYLVFIHTKGECGVEYGGYFTDNELSKNVCKTWNETNTNGNKWADFINVTNEKNDTFILNQTKGE